MIRQFLRDDDVTSAEQTEILDPADAFRAERFHEQPLAGPQSVAVIFDKPSTRTRMSFSVTADLLGHAAPHAIVLHCSPAYRGKETAADVIDGPQSVVWDDAESRLHPHKALLTWLLRHARAES